MRILVLCTGNSARSQMAEGYLRHKGSSRIEAFSAGVIPKGMNPLAVQVMQEIGIDISGQWSKDVAVYEAEKFDLVLTVCDNAKERCPVFPGARSIHWSLPDPHSLEDFRSVRDEIVLRVDTFLAGI